MSAVRTSCQGYMAYLAYSTYTQAALNSRGKPALSKALKKFAEDAAFKQPCLHLGFGIGTGTKVVQPQPGGQPGLDLQAKSARSETSMNLTEVESSPSPKSPSCCPPAAVVSKSARSAGRIRWTRPARVPSQRTAPNMAQHVATVGPWHMRSNSCTTCLSAGPLAARCAAARAGR